MTYQIERWWKVTYNVFKRGSIKLFTQEQIKYNMISHMLIHMTYEKSVLWAEEKCSERTNERRWNVFESKNASIKVGENFNLLLVLYIRKENGIEAERCIESCRKKGLSLWRLIFLRGLY